MSLHILKQNAYSAYCADVLGPPESFEMWDQRAQAEFPQFHSTDRPSWS